MTRRVRSALATLVIVGLAAWFTARSSDETSADADRYPSREAVPAESATVAWITDGDTLKVDLEGGRRASIRLIGIDTPETHAGLECGGPEATAAMEGLVRPGDRVRLQTDPTQDTVDRYGRLLRYVIADGEDLGHQLLVSGAASVYVYDAMFVKGAAYQRAEDSVKAAPRGIWKNC